MYQSRAWGQGPSSNPKMRAAMPTPNLVPLHRDPLGLAFGGKRGSLALFFARMDLGI